jgi:D-hydroxyproline dehydrogenase subunit beta
MPHVARYDDAVVGAGILGLAHAYHLARRGRRVIVLERHVRATGASVRNFGMLWPIGQPLGELRQLAQKSVEIWLEVLASAGLWHDWMGSLHLAYRNDEAQVLREFAQQCRERGQEVALWDAAQIASRARGVKQAGLQLGLWSGSEVCVDPREVLAGLPGWLARQYGVDFQFGRFVAAVELPEVRAGGVSYLARRLWLCCGDELRALYPEHFEKCALVRCKLQMMRSVPQDPAWRIGPMLAAGLTLCHYASFRNCPSLPELRQRVALETPWFVRHGIHVLVSQNACGELTIGDSHEYGDGIEPFNSVEIDEWILAYLKTFLERPELRIASRWNGCYVKHNSEPYVTVHPEPDVVAITGVGGAGMTFSFGLAAQVVARELGESDGG